MIPTLYEPFRHWSDGGSIYILSDLHFDDEDCKFMSPDWITPQEQLSIINGMVMKNDTFICLGDVGRPEYVKDIKARKKILILGNHDAKGAYKNYFDEIYTGPLFIAEKILLSHEPVYGLSWCLNIHGHDHNNMEPYKEGCKHINLAANVCDYTPINLGKIIKEGVLADVSSIHRMTIDRVSEKNDTPGILDVDNIAEKCSEVLEGYEVNFCYLFGSYAKGKATPASDVDLLISANVKGLKFYGLVEEIRIALHKNVDVLDLNQLKNNIGLTEEILKDGLKIYG